MIKFSDNYPMLKEYKDIESYMEELRHYANISETIELDRVEAQKQIVRDKKEIERLNNIINELEKYIKIEKEEYIPLDSYVDGTKEAYQNILDKLQKLKENK